MGHSRSIWKQSKQKLCSRFSWKVPTAGWQVEQAELDTTNASHAGRFCMTVRHVPVGPSTFK